MLKETDIKRSADLAPEEKEGHFFFYGWIVGAISFVTLALAYGAKSFSIFYVVILDECGWQRGTTATKLSLNF